MSRSKWTPVSSLVLSFSLALSTVVLLSAPESFAQIKPAIADGTDDDSSSSSSGDNSTGRQINDGLNKINDQLKCMNTCQRTQLSCMAGCPNGNKGLSCRGACVNDKVNCGNDCN
jgi:hypothetical protein